MSDAPNQPAPGWYYAQGDPPNTQRYWDGTQWQGGPQPLTAPGPVGESSSTAVESNLGSPGQRVLARIIDIPVWFAISLFFSIVVGGGTSTFGQTDFGARVWFAGLLGSLGVAAYEVLMVAYKGGTVGKLALGLRVVKEDGPPADLNTAFMRIVVYFIGIVPIIGSFISFIVGLASFVMLFTDNRRQVVWDKIAKTIVIKV